MGTAASRPSAPAAPPPAASPSWPGRRVEPLLEDDDVTRVFGLEVVSRAACTSSHLIRERLWLGSIAAALDHEEIHLARVTHVVNSLQPVNARFAEALPPPPGWIAERLQAGGASRPGRLEYLSLDLADVPEQELPFEAAVDWIDAARACGGVVLVHCAAGVSRSASLVVAWLMRTEGLTAARALAEVQAARPCADPNPGFRRQLLAWESRLAQVRAAAGLPPLLRADDPAWPGPTPPAAPP